MSCCSTLRAFGSGIVSMFSPTPCHECPEIEEDEPPISSGTLFIMESGNLILTESGHAIEVE